MELRKQCLKAINANLGLLQEFDYITEDQYKEISRKLEEYAYEVYGC